MLSASLVKSGEGSCCMGCGLWVGFFKFDISESNWFCVLVSCSIMDIISEMDFGGDHIWFTTNYNGQSTSELIWNFMDKYDINGRR